jgi:hypothetical protein
MIGIWSDNLRRVFNEVAHSAQGFGTDEDENGFEYE